MKKCLSVLVLALALLLGGSQRALAHVTIKPGEVGVGTRLNFVVSVPTEEETPTVQVRLLIPEGVKSVRPNVKPGWSVFLVKAGEGDEERVAEIIWSGGRIPAEMRDEFVFSAQAPAEETTLAWKAYQTYGDGDVVAWENDPKVVEEYTKNNPPQEGMEDDHDAPRPYSETKVVNDLAVSPAEETAAAPVQTTSSSMLVVVSLALSAGAILIALRNK